jgi:hypothetical protein
MKFKCYVFAVLMFAAFQAYAVDKDYSMCSVAGFYQGENNRFLMDLAERVVAKNNLLNDDKCVKAIRQGKDVGERYIKPDGEKRTADFETIRHAQVFSNTIYDSILSRVKF